MLHVDRVVGRCLAGTGLSLRIAMLSMSDGPGGAGQSAVELGTALVEIGETPRLFVGRQTSDAPFVQAPRSALVHRARAKIEYEVPRLRNRQLIGWFSSGLLPDMQSVRIRSFKPDVVSLHWVNEGFMGIETIPRLPAPVAWTLHDLWPITGGCHVPPDCTKYRTGCGSCPVLDSHSATDLSRSVWRWKERAWEGFDPTLVVPSRWVELAARSSPLMGGSDIAVIPRPVDLGVFGPIDRGTARKALGLPVTGTLAVTGAHSLFSDPNKGWMILERSLASSDVAELDLLVTFGESADGIGRVGNGRVRHLGPMSDRSQLALLLSAADVVIVPSLSESFGRVAAEALACGTPIAAFESPGAGELIAEGVNGFAAKHADPDALVGAIRSAIALSEQGVAVQRACRQSAERFDRRAVAAQYVELFRTLKPR